MASKIPTRAPHGQIHAGVLAKNRLTHVLHSRFLSLRLSAVYRGVLPGERAYPTGVGHYSHRKALVTADRRLSFFCSVQSINQCLAAPLNVRSWM